MKKIHLSFLLTGMFTIMAGGSIAVAQESSDPPILQSLIATRDGDWSDSGTWGNGGVPTADVRVIIPPQFTVELDARDHVAGELVIQGDLVVAEQSVSAAGGGGGDKSLTARWVHVNSGGEFRVGSEEDRYDNGTFTLNLTGNDKYAGHDIETANGIISIRQNDGFLMTAMGGRLQFYGEEKLSFTKLNATVEAGATSITVANVIERNYDQGATNGDGFVTSAADDGAVNWLVDDEIVIASSSYDYTEEDVRIIETINDNGDGTSTITFREALGFRHYGEIETYGDTAAEGTTAASQERTIDLRAEVALLSRNIKVQGLVSQDTDDKFGDRENVDFEPRIQAIGVTDAESRVAPRMQVINGVGGHLMLMGSSGQNTVDGVQLDGLGQSSQKGRYPIHWHLGQDRSGDVLRNSSITNSNNRGVTIHGTSNLLIENVVLHDIHGHGFFFEDAVETGNTLVGNIALGIHKVGGQDRNPSNLSLPGLSDPFVVDTHDSFRETRSRFQGSAAFWITNPTNTFVGNVSAGTSGTGFWYVLPRTVLGDSAGFDVNNDIVPIHSAFGQFDNNTSHSTPVGLNFDRGQDIEDGRGENNPLRTTATANRYSPRTDVSEPNSTTQHFVNGFTNYKASGSAIYHRGDNETLFFNDIKVADSYNAAWSVGETEYTDSLLIGHSRGNADVDVQVGGPRLYDGAGLYTRTHFAGFGEDNAFAFQVEGSSFGPTMYHSFGDTSFEDDETIDSIAHAVSDFQRDPADGHDLNSPQHWSKAVVDLDGTLTSAWGRGVGYSIVPDIDFLVDGDDFQLPGGGAWLTDDIYTRVRLDSRTYDFADETDAPIINFTARDNDVTEVMSGQSSGPLSWVQSAAKTEADGYVNGTFTVEFERDGVPQSEFTLHVRNADGDRPGLNSTYGQKVDASRIVVRIVGAGDHTPSNRNLTQVFTANELRSATSGVVYYRSGSNVLINAGISNGREPIVFTPGISMQSSDQSAPTADIDVPTLGTASISAGVTSIDFSEDISGFDTTDLTLTRAGTVVDISGLVLTQVTPNQYSIDLSTVTTMDGAYELSLSRADSGIADSDGNALATDAMDQFMIGFDDGLLLRGDVNQDGVVNALDISPFISILAVGGFLDEADVNGDGFVNLLDVNPFIVALSGL